jgi:hypothetical protein
MGKFWSSYQMIQGRVDAQNPVLQFLQTVFDRPVLKIEWWTTVQIQSQTSDNLF